MASSAEGSGRSIEAAIEAARSQLGVARDRLDVEVLQEPIAGTFGVVGTPARVRVTVRERVLRERDEQVTVAAGTAAVRAAGGPSPSRPAPSSGGRRAGASATARDLKATVRQPASPRVEVDPEAAVQQAEAAGDFVEGLLELLDLEADITTWADRNGGYIEVEGPDLNVLVGRDGDTLSAVEELTRLAAVRQTGDRVRVVLDINGFRQRRREVLTRLAREAGQRVLEQGHAEELPPMPPHERKVVHDVIAEMAGIATESVGEEPNRRVAIVPA